MIVRTISDIRLSDGMTERDAVCFGGAVGNQAHASVVVGSQRDHLCRISIGKHFERGLIYGGIQRSASRGSGVNEERSIGAVKGLEDVVDCTVFHGSGTREPARVGSRV